MAVWFPWTHSSAGVDASTDLTVNSLTVDAGETANIILDEDDLVSDRDDALATQQSIKAYIDAQIANVALVKSYSFTSQGVIAGTYYAAGYYNAPATDANLTQISPTVTLGSANLSYAAHAFMVAGGAGSAAGGAGAVEIEVSGTSITDAGVRTASDTEVIIADITTLTTDQYLETSKKWIGQVVYTLQNASGSTQTTFSADFNYGYAKYEDFANRDYTLTNFECVGLAGATDTSFNIRLLLHDENGWTYAAAGFVPGGTVILNMNTVHSTEQNLGSGVEFAFKRTGLSQAVVGSGLEGVLVEITTGANNSVEIMDIHIGVDIT